MESAINLNRFRARANNVDEVAVFLRMPLFLAVRLGEPAASLVPQLLVIKLRT
jgi:hypothetical protein